MLDFHITICPSPGFSIHRSLHSLANVDKFVYIGGVQRERDRGVTHDHGEEREILKRFWVKNAEFCTPFVNFLCHAFQSHLFLVQCTCWGTETDVLSADWIIRIGFVNYTCRTHATTI